MPLSSSSNTCNRAPLTTKENISFALFFTLFFILALYFRTSGLFRGLEGQVSIFHPDEPKQILALFNFLNGDYVRYYGSLFYDGYPYGLNHLDEYLLRPFLFLFNAHIPEQQSLYYYARILRVLYSLTVMAICCDLVYRITHCKVSSLLAAILFAISPLSITVSHFATGDIGIDLFCSLCFLFLFLYLNNSHKNLWLLLSGFAVGAAFSAKYNGLLVGIVPVTLLCLQYMREKQLASFVFRTLLLGTGALAGLFLFTPGILIETKPTIANILANFEFIKNYNIPADILNKPWYEKTLMGIQNNSLYTISAIGKTICIASIGGLILAWKRNHTCMNSPSAERTPCTNSMYTLSIAIFPPLALFISLSGKYVVQPFHFSYLLIPLILVTAVLFSQMYSSKNLFWKSAGLLMIAAVIVESGLTTINDNFFWRLEDNSYHSQALPASIFDRESFYTHRSDPIRSLFLEAPGSTIFRNHNLHAKGPDAFFWNTITVAPLPQVPNPVGKDWIFLNGPSFPRNERMFVIHAEDHGETVKKYLVLPAEQKIEGIGLRSGSYATEATITLGGQQIHSELDAHQQKIFSIEPNTWKISTNRKNGQKVHIIPLQVSVPHNDLWITLFTNQKEKEFFTLFGGGQNATAKVPEKIPPELSTNYFDALSRIRYLDHTLSWRVSAGKAIPMWEVSIPAGHYKLISEVDGLVEHSEIAIDFEDAKGGNLHRGQQESFQIHKGIQRVEYSFTKAFAPYQIRFTVTGINGKCQIMKFKLVPDFQKISDDFELWRMSSIQPQWISRFPE